MVMIATVERVGWDRLIVRDRRNFQRVIVNTRDTRCIFPGDIVSIFYNGVMTRSYPPQIFAIRIRTVFPPRNCR